MDEITLVNAFEASIGNNNALRLEAYNYIQSISLTPGLIPTLINLSLHHTKPEIRQVSAIHIKNLLRF